MPIAKRIFYVFMTALPVLSAVIIALILTDHGTAIDNNQKVNQVSERSYLNDLSLLVTKDNVK